MRVSMDQIVNNVITELHSDYYEKYLDGNYFASDFNRLTDLTWHFSVALLRTEGLTPREVLEHCDIEFDDAMTIFDTVSQIDDRYLYVRHIVKNALLKLRGVSSV